MRWRNTPEISKCINKLLSSTFADYHGSAIFINPGNGSPINAQMSVELYFKPCSESDIPEKALRAFKVIGEGEDGNRIAAQLRAINSAYRNINFEITDEGCQILSDFMFTGCNVNPYKPNTFRNYITQFQDNGPIYIKLINVDLTKILRMIYGPKMTDGAAADYLIVPHSPVNPSMLNQQTFNPYLNWKIKVTKASKERVNELLMEMGASGRSPIVTGW